MALPFHSIGAKIAATRADESACVRVYRAAPLRFQYRDSAGRSRRVYANPGGPLIGHGRGRRRHECLAIRALVRHDARQAVLTEDVNRDEGACEPFATLQDLVEHRGRVGDRAADRREHFARGLLLLERLLRLVEQPSVLDRDHRLVGKGCRKCDLFFAKRPRNRARQNQNTNRDAFAEQWNTDHGAVSSGLQNIRHVVFWIKRRVIDVNRSTLEQSATGAGISPGLDGNSLERSLVRDCPNIAAILNTSPSGRNRDAVSASHNLHADSVSVSSTFCKSNAERLMTLSTSAVAVCC